MKVWVFSRKNEESMEKGLGNKRGQENKSTTVFIDLGGNTKGNTL